MTLLVGLALLLLGKSQRQVAGAKSPHDAENPAVRNASLFFWERSFRVRANREGNHITMILSFIPALPKMVHKFLTLKNPEVRWSAGRDQLQLRGRDGTPSRSAVCQC